MTEHDLAANLALARALQESGHWNKKAAPVKPVKGSNTFMKIMGITALALVLGQIDKDLMILPALLYPLVFMKVLASLPNRTQG